MSEFAGTLHEHSGENSGALFPKKIFYHRPLSSTVYKTVSKYNYIIWTLPNPIHCRKVPEIGSTFSKMEKWLH